MGYFSLVVLVFFYLLASVRYFPGDLGKTGVESLIHMMGVAPFTIGCTLLFVSVFQKSSRTKLPWDRVARIFLMMALFFELLLGIQDYIK